MLWRLTISKCWGGLGVKDPRNKALSGKWFWKFGSEVRTLWRAVIAEKYGVLEGEWRTKVIIIFLGLYYGRIYQTDGKILEAIYVLRD